MLASISPLGERARAARWGRTTTSYAVASAVAGGLLGAALGALGSLVPASGAWFAAVAVVAVGGAVLDTRRLVPTVHRQVDETWLTTYRDWVYGAGFGAQLGVGVATIVTSWVVYLTWAIALATRDPAAGAAVGVAFGGVRAAPLLTFAGVREPDELRRRHARLAALQPTARRTAVAFQVLAGAALVAIAAGAA